MNRIKVHVSDPFLEKHFGIRKDDVLIARYEFKGEIREGYMCRTNSGKDIAIYKSECTPYVDN